MHSFCAPHVIKIVKALFVLGPVETLSLVFIGADLLAVKTVSK